MSEANINRARKEAFDMHLQALEFAVGIAHTYIYHYATLAEYLAAVDTVLKWVRGEETE